MLRAEPYGAVRPLLSRPWAEADMPFALPAADAAMSWLAERLGEEEAETEANALQVATFAVTDETGYGLYVELASQAFMDALVPGAG